MAQTPGPRRDDVNRERRTTFAAGAGRRRAAGAAIAGMLLLAVTGAVRTGVPAVAAAVPAWIALALLWPGLGRQQHVQALAFIGAGAAALLWAAGRGAPLDFESVLAQNQPILSMLAAVTALRLLNPAPRPDEPELPRGAGAYLRSMLGVHAFGAIINVSAVVIMADRLARVRPLEPDQAQLLSRAFSAVAFHSPFIGGVALALAYTPGSNPLVLMAYGVPLALAAFLLLAWYAYGGRCEDIENFRGYPVHPEDLRVPVALGAAVLGAAALTSGYSVLSLITVLTPLVVAAALLRRGGVRKLRDGLDDYVGTRAPQMGNELALFLGAGVMAAGLTAASSAAGGWVFFDRLDAFNASLLVLACIVTSAACIHPVVIVGVVAPLVERIDLDPTFLAVTLAMGWGLGCAVNPMSGVNVILSSRYGVSNWRLARGNLAFSATLYVVAVGLLCLYQAVRSQASVS